MFDNTDDILPLGYGEHAMERQDTNYPPYFPNDVTNADPVRLRLQPDVANNMSPTTGQYGAPFTFVDPNNSAYRYTVDLATETVTIVSAPKNKYAGPVAKGTAAYNAIIALAKQKSQVGQNLAASLGQGAANFFDAFTAARFGASGVPGGVPAAAMPVPTEGVPLAAAPAAVAPSTGVPWWVWAAGATVVLFVVVGAMKSGGGGDE